MPQPLQLFGAARVGVGALTWAVPATSVRLFGLGPSDAVLARLFGVRDLALGLLTATTTGATRRQVLQVGIAIDLADCAACAIELRQRGMSTRAKLLTAAGAASFAAFGAAGLAADARA